MLRLEIQNLLNRYDAGVHRLQARPPDTKILDDLKRTGATRTDDPNYFLQRVQREVLYSTENDLTFSVLMLQKDECEDSGFADCIAAAESLIRQYDLILTGPDWIAVLLTEADDNGAVAFLKGVHGLCKAELRCVRCECFRQQTDFEDDIRRLVCGGDVSEKRVLEWRGTEASVPQF